MNPCCPQLEATLLPHTDIIESGQSLKLFVDLPGVGKEGLEITLEKDLLQIRGKRKPAQDKVGRPFKKEFGEVDYLRRFELSHLIDREGIQAKLQDGVLELTLPRKAEHQPKKIEVN